MRHQARNTKGRPCLIAVCGECGFHCPLAGAASADELKGRARAGDRRFLLAPHFDAEQVLAMGQERDGLGRPVPLRPVVLRKRLTPHAVFNIRLQDTVIHKERLEEEEALHLSSPVRAADGGGGAQAKGGRFSSKGKVHAVKLLPLPLREGETGRLKRALALARKVRATRSSTAH